MPTPDCVPYLIMPLIRRFYKIFPSRNENYASDVKPAAVTSVTPADTVVYRRFAVYRAL